MAAAPERGPLLLYLVKRLELAIRARLDEMLAGSGVTTLQYTALTVLQSRGPVSAAQLARESFVTPQAMADMLRALQKRELITRLPHPTSRRELLVSLTEEGAAFLDRYAGAARAIEERMLADLSDADARRFRDALTRTRHALSHAGPAAGRVGEDESCRSRPPDAVSVGADRAGRGR